MDRIKLLHVLHSFDIGGVENGVANLINHSSRDRFSHDICCITRSGDSRHKLVDEHVKIYELNKQPGNDWHIIPRLAKLLGRVKPDIVHTRNWGTIDAIPAARVAGVPIVVHGEHGWNLNDPLGRNAKRRITRRVLSFGVTRFVAVSEDIRQWFIKKVGIQSSKIKTIINGVDTKKYRPSNALDKKAGHGLAHRIIIGSVGRLDPIKQYDLLIYAFTALAEERNDLALVIIGDGPDRLRLESIIKDSPCPDRIFLYGARHDVADFYSIFDIFALVSRNEGISNTILEAMACGLPVVATRVGGNPELVGHMETGLLVSSVSTAEIYGALKYYLENPVQRGYHGKNGRKRTENHFSINHMVQEYQSLYTQLAKKAMHR
mgnify:CR=1 FL=1